MAKIPGFSLPLPCPGLLGEGRTVCAGHGGAGAFIGTASS